MELLDGINDTENELYTFDSIIETETIKGLDALKELKLGNALTLDRKIELSCIIEKELKEKDELVHALSIVTCENGDLLIYKRALKIISEKRVQVGSLLYCSCLEGYNKGRDSAYQLTQEEYDLLKEMLS